MQRRESISELRGVLVIAKEEGAQLGAVTGVHIDPSTRRLAAVSFRSHGAAMEQYVAAENILSIGYDIIFVKSRVAARPFQRSEHPGWRSLRDLQGLWVTSLDGVHLGVLLDLELEPDTGMLADFRLLDGRILPIMKAEEVTIGNDEILVPASYAANVLGTAEQKVGFMGRVLGRETIEGLALVLRRAFKRPRREEPRPNDRKSTHAS